MLASPHAERVQRDFDGLVASISRSHTVHLGEVKPFVVAASPKDCEQVKRGEGVGNLLLFWLQASPPAPSAGEGTHPVFERMIDLLTGGGGGK